MAPASDTPTGDLLRLGIRAARARWTRAFPGTLPHRVLDQALESLRRALAERLQVEDAGPAPEEDPFRDDPSPPDLALHTRPELHGVRRTLLGYVRRTFLEAAPHDPGEQLRALRVLAELEEELEPDWEHQVQAGLMGPAASDLLAEIGHDLRSPLTSVLFLTEAIRSGQSGPVNEVQARQLALLYSAGMTLLTVVNNFVELSRDGQAAQGLARSQISVDEVLASLRESVQPMADDRGIDLQVEFMGGADRMESHAVSLYRILLNLVTNAIRHASEGDAVTVQVQPRPPGWLTFQVRDTGPGIPEERMDSLFRTFEPSADRRGISFSGSGLGLVIVRKLLRELGGSELEVESQVDQGSTFRFRLPRSPDGMGPS
ncbi:MAG: sensor histidine kinase [Gemmatimonadales bacterium]|nr:MAG: sensor histidine kinase [Gemmatimonadales bacterium]